MTTVTEPAVTVRRDPAQARKIGLYCTAGLVMLAAFLPWASASSIVGTIDKTGMEGDGIFSLLLAATVGLCIWRGWRKVAAAPALLLLGLAIYEVIDTSSKASKLNANPEFPGIARVGVGLWLTLAGAAVIAVLVAVDLRKGK